MCGRYVLISPIEELEERFVVSADFSASFEANYNLSPGNYAPVITNREPDKLDLFQFGFTPHWAKKPMYFFNARAEGDYNKENKVGYQGTQGIIHKPAFKKAIRSQRCLIPADAFIEGTTKEKLDKPHLVFLEEHLRPFTFAGIWDEWVDKETGEFKQSFAIITTTPNSLLQKIPHHRSPVILDQKDEKRWLDNEPLSNILDLLKPFPSSKMDAYPIDKAIKNPRSNGAELLKSVGESLSDKFKIESVFDKFAGFEDRKSNSL